ncbi:PREDICTED: putative adhesion G protein-coupled receptor E4P, partial [Nanorana parkeri]|uniref:putative adhesion G protein-coupled receptor E4P n=1 Tax=Nanorana parkeri TaxID=125878 RepID=UPI000855055E
MEHCANQNRKDPFCSVLKIPFQSLNESCQTHNITIEEAGKQLHEMTERLSQALANYSANSEQVVNGQFVTELLYTVEQNVLISFLRAPRTQQINTTELDITMQTSRDVCSHGVQSFCLVSDDDIMEVPCSLVPGDKDGAFLITYTKFNFPCNGSILFTPRVRRRDDKVEFNSKVVSGAITNSNSQNLSSPIIFKLYHLQPLKPLYELICVFWDPVRNGWSDKGCDTGQSDGTYTNCSCTHLSSFALLMALEAPDKIQEDSILTLLSYIGLSLSLLCLCLSLLTFILCRSPRSSHTSILIALCGCLFLGQLLILVGIRQTRIKLLCAFIAGCLQFSFLCAFCWMSIESFLLFMTVRNLRAVNYMASRKSNFPLMCLLGFGIPAVIVGITAAVHPLDYGTDSHCWINLDIIWSFLGPICGFIITNTVLLVLTFHLLRKRLASVNTNVSTLKNTRLLTFKAVAQLFILGCTWGIGYFQFGPQTLIFSYLFTICNSLQGVYIFLVHCLLNQQVREGYCRLFYRICPYRRQKPDISTVGSLQKAARETNTVLLVLTFHLLRKRLASVNTNVSTLKNTR